MKSRASYEKLKVVHESTTESMQRKINEVVDEQCQKETYQKHLMARILQEANKTMEEMEKLKLADFKRKDKNARLKDELKKKQEKSQKNILSMRSWTQILSPKLQTKLQHITMKKLKYIEKG